jgi:hypothetical protein
MGRSLIDLLSTIQHLEAAGVDLYLDQQNIDTTTPMARLLFQVRALHDPAACAARSQLQAASGVKTLRDNF